MADFDGPIVDRKHNQPPLEESIIIDFDAALVSHDGLIDRINKMVEKAEAAGPCTTEDMAGRYGDFIKMTRTAASVVEAERETLNRPLLNAGRSLMARSKFYSEKATGAGAKIRVHLDKYLDDKRITEAKRLAAEAEVERLAQAARQKIIDDANREAARVAEVERQRLQAIADAEAAKERARLQAIEDAAAAEEAREAAKVVVEAEVVEVIAETVFANEPMAEFVSAAKPKTAIRGDYGTTVGTTETWHVEVLNIRQVPDAYLKHPEVLAALAKVIAPMVRGKAGLREIKGCRVYSTVGSSVR
jgi:hypothetical protein